MKYFFNKNVNKKITHDTLKQDHKVCLCDTCKCNYTDSCLIGKPCFCCIVELPL